MTKCTTVVEQGWPQPCAITKSTLPKIDSARPTTGRRITLKGDIMEYGRVAIMNQLMDKTFCQWKKSKKKPWATIITLTDPFTLRPWGSGVKSYTHTGHEKYTFSIQINVSQHLKWGISQTIIQNDLLYIKYLTLNQIPFTTNDQMNYRCWARMTSTMCHHKIIFTKNWFS